MAEESSPTSDESVFMTTTDETTVTGGNTMTSPSSRGIEFYFHVAIVVIGVIGTAANGLILYALVASKQHHKHVLIVNQNALDLFSCIFLVITYATRLGNVPLTGWSGYCLCMLILTDNVVWWGVSGSIINLAMITIERYLNVVHATWSKAKLRNWMIYSAMAFSWIAGIVYISVLVFLTSAVVNGTCYTMIFENEAGKWFYFFWHLIMFYVVIIILFAFCYGRILLAVRRQAKIMLGHASVAGAGSNASQNQLNQIQTNVIKTMILVCGYYAIMWLPSQISTLTILLSPNPNPHLDSGYYITLFLAFLYTCTNPFIYATKFDPVKEILLRVVACKKTNDVSMA